MKARREGVRAEGDNPAAKRGQIGAIFGEKFYRFSFVKVKNFSSKSYTIFAFYEP